MRASATKSTGILAGFSVLAVLSASIFGIPGQPESHHVNAAGARTEQFSSELLQPAAPGSNVINTNSKSEVREAFLDHYQKNMIRPVTSVGVDIEQCEPGQAVLDGVKPMVEVWNFLRGLNGLNAVSLDETGTIAPYTQAAALTSTRNQKLSHYPVTEGFACADDNAARGARHSNLAQSVSHTSAEAMLWYYMDYSTPSNPVNDQLGHRLLMQDPQLKLTSIGAAGGYTAISVRTGESYPGMPAEDMRDREAPVPDWMSWPSAGFFPKQLLTSVGKTSAGPDMERWSFSVQDADLSAAQASIIDPDGNELNPIVLRPGEPGVPYTPRTVANYSTLLMKFPTIERLPIGHENLIYTVRITGVKNAAQSSYEYKVALFDPLTPLEKSPPTLHMNEQPLTGVGHELPNPIRMTVSAWPVAKYQWQQRLKGGEWTNIPGANQDEYLPRGEWTWERSRTTEYRLVATSTEGEATSEPIRVGVQGLKSMPSSVKASLGGRAVFEAEPILDPNGSLFDTTFEWQVRRADKWYTLKDDGHYEGTRTNRLIVTKVNPADQGSQFRIVVRSKIFMLAGYDAVTTWSDGLAKLSVY